MKKKTLWGRLELESDLGVAFNIYGNEVLWDSTCVTQVYTYAPCAIRPPRLRCGRFTFTCRVIIIHQPSDNHYHRSAYYSSQSHYVNTP